MPQLILSRINKQEVQLHKRQQQQQQQAHKDTS